MNILLLKKHSNPGRYCLIKQKRVFLVKAIVYEKPLKYLISLLRKPSVLTINI